MPWSSRKWHQISNSTSLMLGLIASFPINLATFWFQFYILSNGWYTALAIILIVAASYWFINRRTSLATIVFVTLAYGIILNLLASWFFEHVLNNTFTGLGIILILLFSILIPLLTNFIASRPISTYMKRQRSKLRRRAQKASLASTGKVHTRKKRSTRKKKTQRRWWE